MYLLDTNICIYLIKHQHPQVLNRIKSISPDDVFISSITVAELSYGVEKSQRKEQNRSALLKFLSPFKIISFTEIDAAYFGKIRATLEAKGTPIGAYDLQIAAQALSESFILVTNNVREFERIEDLAIENWVLE